MTELHQKNYLPVATDFSTSPTEQRIGLEKAFVATITRLRQDITDADQAIKSHSIEREAEADRLTNETMFTGNNLHAFIKQGYLVTFSFDNNRGSHPTESNDGVYRFEIESMNHAATAAGILAEKGLKTFIQYKLTPTSLVWIAYDPAVTSLEAIREKIFAGHLAKLDEKASKLPAVLKEAKAQFELFKKHFSARCDQITSIDALCKSPLL